MDGLNDFRTERVSQVLAEFHSLQHCIADVPADPINAEEYYTEGWAALRQCAIDGQHILNCAADVTVPQAQGGELEQAKAELKQILLDAYSRRHVARKIYHRQAAATRWVEYRENVLQGQRPNRANHRQLRACDDQLRRELSQITDDGVYQELRSSDIAMGYWTAEDPSLRSVRRWVQARPQTT
ncbi:uncharacterized protein GGS25DRAFT_393887 [Hypoxylon fragiforme]|uniref:uncharacterized protein n=1 Tax=Hypoxylon fragiforme TaxID=63214 RepID=UPI0020C7206D|nr:uncharacterized protein GGS25DRAFT_393887 [Hypoxylon fragiforme]KAI2606508.1 hypothetical protein GGS25DRAFT_393887 [Hypoxylon fragiforme]